MASMVCECPDNSAGALPVRSSACVSHTANASSRATRTVNQIGRQPPLSSNKAKSHFPRLKEATGVPFDQMLFFDDCNWVRGPRASARTLISRSSLLRPAPLCSPRPSAHHGLPLALVRATTARWWPPRARRTMAMAWSPRERRVRRPPTTPGLCWHACGLDAAVTPEAEINMCSACYCLHDGSTL